MPPSLSIDTFRQDPYISCGMHPNATGTTSSSTYSTQSYYIIATARTKTVNQ